MSISQDILDEIALSRSEYELIIDKIDRDPNGVELGLFGALWSEHCKTYLARNVTSGEWIKNRVYTMGFPLWIPLRFAILRIET